MMPVETLSENFPFAILLTINGLIGLVVLSLVLLFCALGCKKRKPNETEDEKVHSYDVSKTCDIEANGDVHTNGRPLSHDRALPEIPAVSSAITSATDDDDEEENEGHYDFISKKGRRGNGLRSNQDTVAMGPVAANSSTLAAVPAVAGLRQIRCHAYEKVVGDPDSDSTYAGVRDDLPSSNHREGMQIHSAGLALGSGDSSELASGERIYSIVGGARNKEVIAERIYSVVGEGSGATRAPNPTGEVGSVIMRRMGGSGKKLLVETGRDHPPSEPLKISSPIPPTVPDKKFGFQMDSSDEGAVGGLSPSSLHPPRYSHDALTSGSPSLPPRNGEVRVRISDGSAGSTRLRTSGSSTRSSAGLDVSAGDVPSSTVAQGRPDERIWSTEMSGVVTPGLAGSGAAPAGAGFTTGAVFPTTAGFSTGNGMGFSTSGARLLWNEAEQFPLIDADDTSAVTDRSDLDTDNQAAAQSTAHARRVPDYTSVSARESLDNLRRRQQEEMRARGVREVQGVGAGPLSNLPDILEGTYDTIDYDKVKTPAGANLLATDNNVYNNGSDLYAEIGTASTNSARSSTYARVGSITDAAVRPTPPPVDTLQQITHGISAGAGNTGSAVDIDDVFDPGYSRLNTQRPISVQLSSTAAAASTSATIASRNPAEGQRSPVYSMVARRTTQNTRSGDGTGNVPTIPSGNNREGVGIVPISISHSGNSATSGPPTSRSRNTSSTLGNISANHSRISSDGLGSCPINQNLAGEDQRVLAQNQRAATHGNIYAEVNKVKTHRRSVSNEQNWEAGRNHEYSGRPHEYSGRPHEYSRRHHEYSEPSEARGSHARQSSGNSLYSPDGARHIGGQASLTGQAAVQGVGLPGIHVGQSFGSPNQNLLNSSYAGARPKISQNNLLSGNMPSDENSLLPVSRYTNNRSGDSNYDIIDDVQPSLNTYDIYDTCDPSDTYDTVSDLPNGSAYGVGSELPSELSHNVRIGGHQVGRNPTGSQNMGTPFRPRREHIYELVDDSDVRPVNRSKENSSCSKNSFDKNSSGKSENGTASNGIKNNHDKNNSDKTGNGIFSSGNKKNSNKNSTTNSTSAVFKEHNSSVGGIYDSGEAVWQRAESAGFDSRSGRTNIHPSHNTAGSVLAGSVHNSTISITNNIDNNSEHSSNYGIGAPGVNSNILNRNDRLVNNVRSLSSRNGESASRSQSVMLNGAPSAPLLRSGDNKSSASRQSKSEHCKIGSGDEPLTTEL